MVLSWLRTLLQQRALSPRRDGSPAGRAHSFRPALEELEHRLAPAVDTWTGASTTSNLWSDGNNWQSGKAPMSGDDLIFQAGAKQLTNFNNLPAFPNFINSIQINGNGYNLQGNLLFLAFSGISNPSGTNTISMPIDLIGNLGNGGGAQDTNIDIGVGGAGVQLNLNGPISSQFFTAAAMMGFEGLLINATNGVVSINNGNSYTGNTTMTGGITELRNSSGLGSPGNNIVIIQSGATLQLIGGLAISSEPLSLSGNGATTSNGGPTGTGALQAVSGSDSWAGSVTLGNSATVSANAGASLTFPSVISDTNPVTMMTSGFALMEAGAGTVVLTGGAANTFTGGVTVLSGVMVFDKSPGVFAFGAPLVTVPVTPQTAQTLIIGNGSGARDSAEVLLESSNQLPATAAAPFIGTQVTVNSDGFFNLSDFSNIIFGLAVNGGDVATSSIGLLTLAEATAVINGTGDVNSTGGGTISGNVALQGGVAKNPRIFNVNSGNLIVSAVLSSAASQQPVAKNGAGTLTLSGANTYTGAVTINAGTVNIQNATALGAGASLTTVTNGAALQVQGGITQLHPLNVSGVGPTGAGAIENVSGNNFFTAAVALATNPVNVAVDAGELDISGVISGAGFGLTQLGPGILVLAAADTYTGVTTINGTLSAGGVAATIAGQLVMNTGSTLALSAGVTAAGVAFIPSQLTVSSVNGVVFNSGTNFVERIQGVTAPASATGADRLNVTGAAAVVSLGTTNVTLVPVLNYKAAVNDTYTIINAGAGTVNITGGRFVGHPNNPDFIFVTNTFTSPQTSSELRINYPAAVGSSLTLTYLGTVPLISALSVFPNPVNVGTPTSLNATFVDPDNANSHTVTINWGDGTANTVLNLAAGGAVTQSFGASHTYNSVGNFTATVTVLDNGTGLSGVATPLVSVIDARIIVTGTDVGDLPEVKVFNAVTGALKFDFFAYSTSFTGGVRVAVGDVNGDSIPDIITVPGPGGPAEVRVFDGVTGALLRDFYAFDPSLTTGFFVAAGPDFQGGNFADIVVAPDVGGPAEVKAFKGTTTAVLFDFYAYAGGFTGGVRVAVGDVNHDGVSDIITGTGPGSLPEVRVFSGVNNALLQDYYAFSTVFPGGIFVAAGDINGDGFADIIAGAGAGSNPQVNVFSGANESLLRSFYPYPFAFDGGVTVGAINNLAGDGVADILTAPGLSPSVGLAEHATVGFAGVPGGVQPVLALDGLSLAIVDAMFAYGPNYTGGVYVAG